MRISKQQARALAEHSAALARSRSDVSAEWEWFVANIGIAEAALGRAIRRHNDAVAAARQFVAAVAEDLRDQYDGKSEKWQESEAGQAADAMVTEWEDAALEDVAPVRVLLPDPPHFEEGLNLPEESDS